MLLAGVGGAAEAERKLEVRFGADGLAALRWAGIDVLGRGAPSVGRLVFETASLDKHGLRQYAFEKADGSAPRASFDAGAKRLSYAYDWGSVDFAYAPGPDRLDVAVTISNRSKRALADFQMTLGALAFPALPMASDKFSARWTGEIEPRYSEDYTFHTRTDDGVRLWVDGKLIVDKWVNQAPTEHSGTVRLAAGRRYDIKMEYYENTGGAVAQLMWSSASQKKEVVPTSQLFPGAAGKGTGLKGEYFSDMELKTLRFARTDPRIDFDWGEGSPEGEGISLGPDLRSTLDDLVVLAVPFGKAPPPGKRAEMTEKAALVSETFEPAMHFGLKKGPSEGVYDLVVAGGVNALSPNGVEYPPLGYPRVEPGKAVTLRFSFRFAKAGTPTDDIVADVLDGFRRHHSPGLVWDDRRPVGALFIPSGKGPENNPRNWFNNKALDVRTPEGKRELRRLFLEYAERSIGELRRTNAQGMVVWNLEGEENPHPTTYIGDPRLAKFLAPEADEIYDEFFAKFKQAGFKVGCTLRPTQVYFDKDKKQWDHGTGSHGPDRNPLGDDFSAIWPEGLPWWRFYPVAERLSRKIEYAKKRWGATIFYVDTNGVHRQVGENQEFKWTLLECRVWREVLRRHPDVLLIPEFASAPAQYAYTSCYLQPPFSPVMTRGSIRRLFPQAFSVSYVVNLPREQLEELEEQILDGLRAGDSMFFRGWFGDWYNPWIKSLYDSVYKPGEVNPGLPKLPARPRATPG